MSENQRVKITVVKVPEFEDVSDKIPLTIKRVHHCTCPLHKVGQEFIVDSESKPEGVCNYAWNALWPFITTIRHGGDYTEFYEEPGKFLGCCVDAARPVSFLIERI